MTPAERARLVDKREFEAECRAVRERVYARLGIKDAEDHTHVQSTMAIPVGPVFVKRPIAAQKPKRPRDQNGRLHAVAGRSLTRKQWAAELGITYNNMCQQVHKLGSVEAVVIRRLGGSANG
jgi:hypothetical protein